MFEKARFTNSLRNRARGLAGPRWQFRQRELLVAEVLPNCGREPGQFAVPGDGHKGKGTVILVRIKALDAALFVQRFHRADSFDVRNTKGAAFLVVSNRARKPPNR